MPKTQSGRVCSCFLPKFAKKPRILLSVATLLFCGLAAVPGFAQSSQYGSAINADGMTANTIGPHQLSFRFLSTHTGTVSELHLALTVNGPKPSDDNGTGGTLRIQLETDDGTSAHNPSGKILATASIVHPSSNFPLVRFSPAPTLRAGTLYHFVFTNVYSRPTANYVSVNTLTMKTPLSQMQPKYSNDDWAALMATSSSGWSLATTATPVMEIDFSDGTSLGSGYMEVWSGVPKPISGSAAVREEFTVSGGNQTASTVSLRLARVSGSGALTVRLESSSGTLIEQGTIPSSAVPLSSSSSPAYVWATYTFSALRTLFSGDGYHIVFEAPSGTKYEAYPIRKGSGYSFKNSTYFPDGYAQFTANGSSWAGWTQWGVNNRTDGDLQFYFALAGPDSPVSITTSSLPSGTEGASYSAQLSASGGTAPYTWSISAGSLPAGVTLNSSTGALSGTPTTSGTANFTVKVSDPSTQIQTATQAFAVSIAVPVQAAAPALKLTTTSLPLGTVGLSYSGQLTAAGGTAPYRWSGSSLPAGASLNASTGAISGVPTVAGTFAAAIQVTDSSSPKQSSSATLSLTISAIALKITTASLANATAGTAYSAQLSASGGTTPYTWSASGLPSGVSLSTSGALSGKPTSAGNSNIAIHVTDSSATKQTASVTLSLNVVASASSSASAAASIYGPAIGAEALDNIPVGCGSTFGTCANQVDYRFLNTHAGTVKSALVYLILNGPHPGYNAGTNGTLVAKLETDSGGNPSGTALGTATIIHPSVNTSPVSDGFGTLTFSPAPTLQANTMYHVVFSNSDSSPGSNFYSVDTIWWNNGLSPMQPKYSNSDWATYTSNNGTSWNIYHSGSGGNLTPVMGVNFTDGTSIGMGYMEVWSGVGYTVSGSTEVRETFTYSGATATYSQLGFAIALKSGSDPVTATVETSSGNKLATAIFEPSNFNSNGPKAGGTWPVSNLSSPVTFTKGQSYNLVITVPSSSSYNSWAVRKGVSYGFSSQTYFSDGNMQYSTNGGSSWSNVKDESGNASTQGDMMFYFVP